MIFRKTITPLYQRVIVFLGIFVVLSGSIGPKIISGDLLRSGGFEVYGSIGKAAIFTLIAFVILTWQKRKLELDRWRPTSLIWILAGSSMFALSWLTVDALLAGQRDPATITLAHTALVLCIFCFFIGCFGIKNLLAIGRTYKRELVTALLFTVVFYLFLLFVYALWLPLASIVMNSVSWLLEASGHVTTTIPPNKLVLDKFGITVAESCSGIESIALFTSLYAIVGLIEWHRLNKKLYLIVFPAALVILFIFNILRVYGLIIAGYYISQEIAFSLFHTYAGMIFFIIYSAFFWTIAYKHLVKQYNN
jgi:exosortase/archaeosortase family protein